MKKILFFLILLPFSLTAQVTDNFEDGNITGWTESSADRWVASDINPITGNYSLHHIYDNLASDHDQISYDISSLNVNSGTTTWWFQLKHAYNPSSGNNWSVFLFADSSASYMCQDSIVNGYLVGVNYTGSDDTLRLWKISAGAPTELIKTNIDWEDSVGTSTAAGFQISRTADGTWNLKVDTDGDYDNLTNRGTAFDDEFTNSNYFGLYYEYTSAQDKKIWFDNFILSQAPIIMDVETVNDTTLNIAFSEKLEKTSAETISNYSITPAITINSATLINSDSIVTLSVSKLATENYTLIVDNVKDLENLSMDNVSYNFSYSIPVQYGDVVINEIMADHSPTVGLPEYEYLEIFNNFDYDVNLTDWSLCIGNKIKTFPNIIIQPDSFLIICPTGTSDNFSIFGNTLELIGSTDLTNSGQIIILKDKLDNEISKVSYTTAWYNNNDKDEGGWSIEKIDPDNNCGAINNWTASIDALGGTPGKINSVDAPNIDISIPVLENIKVINDKKLLLTFSEPLKTNSAGNRLNYTVNNGIGNPDSSKVDNDDASLVNLYFTDSFIEGQEDTLQVENISDLCDNVIETTKMAFAYYIVKPNDIIINEVMADPSPVVGLPDFEYIELYNNSVNDIDIIDWTITVGTNTKKIPDYSLNKNDYLILCNTSAESELNIFGNTLALTSFPTITNSGQTIEIKDSTRTIISSVDFTDAWYHDSEKEEGGWSIEKIDPDNNCGAINNWTASTDQNGGTPGKINSVDATNIDTQAPILESIKVINDKKLLLTFSEPLKTNSAENRLNYTVNNGIGNPDSSKVDDDDASLVNLYFTNSFVEGQGDTLQVESLSDLCDNEMETTKMAFTYYIVKPNDLVINEIMADPSPVVGLPDYEYIELYNNSGNDIDIIDWEISVGTNTKTIPNYSLNKNDYLILCSTSAESELNIFGNTLAITSFPTITNSGQTIEIIDSTGTIISAVDFTDAWYHDIEKEEGGWSIEKIDPDNNCGAINNWTASTNQNGGTPGKINSVDAPNIDASAPELLSVSVVSKTQISLYFSEYLKQSSAENKLNYTIDNAVGHPLVAVIDNDNQSIVNLYFVNDFVSSKKYIVTIKNVYDLCDNKIKTTEAEFSYYPAQPNDIVINEIMCDPEPEIQLPNYEYIELYNNSSSDIDLNNWTLTVGSSTKDIPHVTIKADSYLILCSTSAISELSFYGNTLGLISFTSLPNTSQLVYISDNNGTIISLVEYSDTWYQDEMKKTGGWSLEQIDPNNPRGGINNWISSKDNNGGTPGKKNSVFASNPDLSSPELINITILSDSSIQLFFNESLDTTTVMNNLIYSVDNNLGNPVIIDPVELLYKSIILTFYKPFDANTIYTLTITGELSDCAGNIIDGYNSQQFAIPETAESLNFVINELLFNPVANNVDFVEIYNRSNKTINLKDIYIATRDEETNDLKSISQISENGYLFFPKEYLVLTTDIEKVKQQYYTSNASGFLQLKSLPTLNDDKGVIIFLDRLENIIDEFSYTKDMHFSLLNDFNGVSLERINFDRPTNKKSNWHSAAENVGFATPAYKNSQYSDTVATDNEITIEPEVFSPDNDGYNDLVNFHYKFEEPGYLANVTIYDSNGREIKRLVKSELLATQGIISWNGLDDFNQKAKIGIFVAYFEIFDLNGNVKKFKKVCVLAGKF
ncbi:MAG: lamin tail domain-containing protein [Bacteroidetes bacterium]|nr:lamin tail domain-containing protein [Bacteroidota bacterium]